MGDAPGNTLRAFEAALAAGANMLELDVRATADGRVVVVHDPYVDSTTNGSGSVASFTYENLRLLDAGWRWTADERRFPFRNRNISIPLLSEVFARFPEARINVDIKDTDPDLCLRTGQLIREYKRVNRTVVGSFHQRVIRRFRRLFPEIATAGGPSEVKLFLVLQKVGLADLFRPSFDFLQIPERSGAVRVLSPRFVASAHRRGLHVHVWTLNDDDAFARAIAAGADGIVTDYPQALSKFVDERSSITPH
jgi:glycerophosphoryl diester phosphodiesterase